MMMMMKYKRACRQKNHPEPPSTTDKTIRPKRVSFCGSTEQEEVTLAVSSFAPIPAMREATMHPPLKVGPPYDDIAFATPINAKRRLNFIAESTESLSSSVNSSNQMDDHHRRAALVSPRVSPDLVAKAHICPPEKERYDGKDQSILWRRGHRDELPSSLYMPPGQDDTAAWLLLGLKEGQVPSPVLSSRKRKFTDKVLSVRTTESCRKQHQVQESSHSKSGHALPKTQSSFLLKSVPLSNRSGAASLAESGETHDERSQHAAIFSSTDRVAHNRNPEKKIRLTMPDDPKELNSLHCFVRADLLEIFVMDTPSKTNRGIGFSCAASGRVGFRCSFCGHLPRKAKNNASMSVFFPKSLGDIYRSVCTWQRIHFKSCEHVPIELSKRYDYLKETDRTRGKKAYWINSAFELGLRNVNDSRGGIMWERSTSPADGGFH